MYSSIDYIELTQYLSGFINATFFLLTNAIIGWGTYPAIRITLPVLIAHNTFDTILGKYWKTDKTLFYHHLLAIFLCTYMYQIDGYKTNTYEIIWWLSLSEINSFLNCIRWFYKGTQIQHHLHYDRDDARHIRASIQLSEKEALSIQNVYVPAGKNVPDASLNPKFAHKMHFVGPIVAGVAGQFEFREDLIVWEI